jgi:predicted Zn-dependent protease
MSRYDIALAFIVGAASFLGSAPAFAFCRTNSCDEKRGEVCSLDHSGCLTGGIDLAWTSSCVTFNVQKAGSTKNNIPAEDFEQVITDAFTTWTNANCGEGQHPAIAVDNLGVVDCTKVEYNKDYGNANIYLFRDDDWTATGPGNALALTTVWYDWKTGEIYDADVEVNGTDGDITNSAPEDGADLPSIITHESGHFLGLAHSLSPNATMFTYYEPMNGNLRELSSDDVAGICAIYPPSRVAKTNDCTPRHGFASSCRKPPDSGCATVPGPSPVQGGLSAVFALAGAALVRRRRQRA